MNLSDLKIEVLQPVQKSGQHVGVIPVGVTVTHIPSGLSATCVTLRSQMKNRDVALAMIESGLSFLDAYR